MLRENHPLIINLSFFRLYLYQHVMVRLPSVSPVTQTLPLSKESKESLVYIHVCVRDFGKSRALVSRRGITLYLPYKLYRLLCGLFRRITASIVSHSLIRGGGIKSGVAVDGAVRC